MHRERESNVHTCLLSAQGIINITINTFFFYTKSNAEYSLHIYSIYSSVKSYSYILSVVLYNMGGEMIIIPTDLLKEQTVLN